MHKHEAARVAELSAQLAESLHAAQAVSSQADAVMRLQHQLELAQKSLEVACIVFPASSLSGCMAACAGNSANLQWS